MRRSIRASAASIPEAARRVYPATGRVILRLLGSFLQIGADSLPDTLNRKPGDDGKDSLT